MLYVPQGGPPPHQPPMHPLNALRNRAVAAAQTEVTLFSSSTCLFFFAELVMRSFSMCLYYWHTWVIAVGFTVRCLC